MSVFQRILVAVDGSETSDLGLQKAIELAKDQKAALRVLHVTDMAPVIVGYADFGGIEDLMASIRASGEEIVARAQAAAAKASVAAEGKRLEIGRSGERVAGMIEKEAREWRADLVVIGTHGRRGFNHLVMGSVAESLVRLASQPVLLIRAQPPA